MKKTALKFASHMMAITLMTIFFTNCKKENSTTSDLELNKNEIGHSHQGVRCSMQEHQENNLRMHPESAERKKEIEDFTAKFAQEYGKTARERAVITIPVVVHVLYNTATQNISDAQIASQMTVLNNDFRKLNGDASSVPNAFKPLAADVEVVFVMAKQTPTGAATTGIVRKSTTKTSFIDNLDLYSDNLGGSNIWDASRYLNIYVCKLAKPLGFAADPSFPDSENAVVVHFEAFGTIGTAAASPYNLGRTATHEVGHWLNLAHIWGPGDPDVSNCNDSDSVSDTPNQSKSNFGTPTFPSASCGNTPNGDMFMNYMDYVDDGAMFMFTQGQKVRMLALFAPGGARATVATSIGGNPPSGANACGTPTSLTTSNVTSTSANLGWAAVSGATSYTVQYKTSASATYTTSNSSNNSLTISGLSANTAYQCQVKSTCASGTSAYTTTANFTTLIAVTPPVGCTDNYESNNTSATAKSIPLNTAITAKIGTTSDIDWFTFTTTSAQPKFKVDLTNLPFDYDIELYKNGTLLGYSQNDGTLNELIKNNATTAGTYKLKVYPYGGVFSNTNCYTLKVQTGATNFKVPANTNPKSNKKRVDVSEL